MAENGLRLSSVSWPFVWDNTAVFDIWGKRTGCLLTLPTAVVHVCIEVLKMISICGVTAHISHLLTNAASGMWKPPDSHYANDSIWLWEEGKVKLSTHKMPDKTGMSDYMMLKKYLSNNWLLDWLIHKNIFKCNRKKSLISTVQCSMYLCQRKD